MASTHAHDHPHGAHSHAPGHDHGHGAHDHDHGHGDGPRDASEGSVMLCFCAAAVVALLGAAWGRPKAHDAGHGQAAAAHAPELREAVGTGGAVATSAPEATEAALAVLREGGNAADGLVAASFVLAVVRPQSTGIGGGGFALYHDAGKKVTSAVDGREVAPRGATPRMFLDASGAVDEAASKDGPKAAAVPGLVAMLAELHERHGSGKVRWRRLLEPAIRHAREGFAVKAGLARAIAERRAVLARYPASAALFLPAGRAPEVGAKLANPELARTLEAIAEHGARGFYEGWVAEAIAQGGVISAADLAGYRATTPAPVVGSYRGMKVTSFPLPSSGGVLLIHMLNVMSGWDLKAKGWHSPDHLHLLAETMRHAYADRERHLGDVSDAPVEWLTSPEYAAQVRQGIDPRQATPSADVKGGVPAKRGHTTHISVVDAAGNACSSTQTINTGLGSGFVVGGTGILLNNEMDDFAAKAGASNAFGLVQGEANLPGPGKRPLSSMSPTIVTDAQGRVRLVLGSPGGGRIITSVLQVLSNVIDFDMNLHQAIDSPRIHHQWKPDELLVEPDLAHTKVDALAARGHTVHRLDRRGLGEVNAVLVRASGERVAVSDPRGEGRPGAQ